MTQFDVILCPHCSARLRTKNPRPLSKQIRCPKCSASFNAETAIGKADRQKIADDPSSSAEAPSSGDNLTEEDYGTPVAPIGSGQPPKERADSELEEKQQQKRKKKKRPKRTNQPAESSPFKLWLYGLIGGLVGGVIWVAVAYFSGLEWGFIALLVGILTGVGVQTAMVTQEDPGSGEAGIFAAVLVVAACRYVVACLLAKQLLGEDFLKTITQYDLIWFLLAGASAYRVASGGLD